MFLPIGHERSTVRRFPVATAALIGACVAVFVISTHDLAALDRELLDATREAAAFVEGHPYLEPNAAQLDELPAACRARVQALAPGAPAPGALASGASSRDPQAQHELDARCARLAAALAQHPFLRWGLVPAEPRAHAWITYSFLHAGWLHLAGNMLLLFLAGFCLEELWGRPLFLALYASGTVVSAAFFALVYPDLGAPLVGASGAVAALMGAFLVRCWDTRITFAYLVWFGVFRWGQFRAPAWVALPLWFAQELASAVALDSGRPAGGGDGVAHWAHVGGFSYGMCVALLVQASGLERRWIAPALERKQLLVHRPALLEAELAERAGDLEHAFDLLRAEVARLRAASSASRVGPVPFGFTRAQPPDPSYRDAITALWTLACRCDRADDAAPALADAIAESIGLADWDEALVDLAELLKHAPAARVAPRALHELTAALLDARRLEDARFALQAALGRPGCAFPGPGSVALVKCALAVDARLGLYAARLALEQPALESAQRSELEALQRGAEAHGPAPAPEPGSAWDDPRAVRGAASRARGGSEDLGRAAPRDGAAQALDELGEPKPETDPGLFDRSGRRLGE